MAAMDRPITTGIHGGPVAGMIRHRHTLFVLLILLAAGLIEWANGRSLLCPCGHVALWTGTVHGPENSQQIADWYSLSHLVHGLLFYGGLWLVARRWPVGRRLVLATAIEAGWELLENSPIIIDRYRAATMAWGYSGDSVLNSMSDILFMIAGFLIARRLPTWGSVALGLALELIALAAIRDNLTLNVLMLVHPIEAVRVWQGG
jgi:hypothetical protein